MSDPWEIPEDTLSNPAYWRGLASGVLEEAARTEDHATREVLHAIAVNLETAAKDAEQRLRDRALFFGRAFDQA